jgi:amino acid transporter
VALAMFGILASIIIAMSFAGASVQDAYLTLLDLAVALQMLSYLYLFASLAKRAFSNLKPGRFGRTTLQLVSVVGVAMTSLGFCMAFVPSRQISSIWFFELKMIATLAVLLGLGSALYVYYSRRSGDTVQ